MESKGNNIVLLARPEDVPEDIVKLAAFCLQGTAGLEAEELSHAGVLPPAGGAEQDSPALQPPDLLKNLL